MDLQHKVSIYSTFSYPVYRRVDTHIIYHIGNTQNGRTALHDAISKGHTDIAKLLIQSGANIDLQDKVSTYSTFKYHVYRRVDTHIIYHIGNT